MRKFLLLMVCFCLLTGCAPAPSPTPAAEPKISITAEHSSLTAQDGTVLLRRTSPRIIVTMPTTAAADAIYQSLSETEKQWTQDLADWEGIIAEAYQQGKAWEPWFCEIKAEPMRLDKQVLSIYYQCSKFSGGNHPALLVDGVNFDSHSGRKLALSDLLAEGHALWELTTLVNEELALLRDQLYDDYEALVSKAFSDGDIPAWYLSDSGLCFAFAPYAIGPYASGIITIELSYEKLGQMLRPAYL